MSEQLKEWLEHFWSLYIRPEMTHSELNQVFAKGPYGGYSVRELMEAAVRVLGYKMPKIVNNDEYPNSSY